MLNKQRVTLQQYGIDFDSFQLKGIEERKNILFNIQSEYLGNNKKVNHLVPVVSVCIPTYQHAHYIKECIEGALMQKTSFLIEIVIGDDGSIDGTTEICRQYAEQYSDRIRLYDRSREMCRVFDNKGHVVRSCNWWWTLQEARGKYIAICEGDDYWTDPYKLQKQVNVMEANPEYSMCCTNCIDYIQINGKMRYSPLTNKNVIVLEDLLYNKNMIATLTVLCRKELILEYNSKLLGLLPKWPLGDYPLWIWMSTKGTIYKMPDKTAVYRILSGSASHSEDENKGFFFGLAGYEIRLYFCALLNKSSLSINLMRKYYVLRFVCRRFWRQLDKLKYLFQLSYK